MATNDLKSVPELEQILALNGVVIIDFWASWCGPCKMFGPIFEKVSTVYETISFGKVNTEEAQELAGSFGVTSIPTLAIFRENILVFKQPGMLSEQALHELIKKVLELNMDKIRAEIAG